MAKDPAFLFYTGDFATGTQFFTDDQVGRYIRALMAQHQHGRLTEKQINFIVNKDEDVLSKFKIDENSLYYNERLEIESNKRKAFSESRSKSRTKTDEDNVRIYIVRDNVRLSYKIGSSTNPLRRYNELCNKSNTTIVENSDITLIWYSEPVLRIEETKLHSKFKNKRISGEWFMLEDLDLSFIYENFIGKKIEHKERTYFRTNKRTEDKNENEIKIEDKPSIEDNEAKEFLRNEIRDGAWWLPVRNETKSYVQGDEHLEKLLDEFCELKQFEPYNSSKHRKCSFVLFVKNKFDDNKKNNGTGTQQISSFERLRKISDDADKILQQNSTELDSDGDDSGPKWNVPNR